MFRITFRRLKLPGRVRLRRRTRRTRKNPEYIKHRESARALIAERLAHFRERFARLPAPLGQELSQHMQYRRVAIRDQRSRWGSCSAKKNLNFNYRLVHLSPEHRDYVIVHELCHLVEMNHGANFWKLMERIVPDARALQTEVRKIKIPR